MIDYQSDVPKAAFAVGAVALSTLIFAAFVVAPVVFDSGYEPAMTFAAAQPPIEVTISPPRIDVIAVRAPNVAWALTEDGKPNCKPQG